MWTMDPPPRSRMGPATILVSTKAPTRLIRSTSAKSSGVTFSSGALRRTAAEFTSTSTPPHSRRVSDTRRATSASTPTSPASACPTPPAASMACATSWSGSGLRPNRATRAPSPAPPRGEDWGLRAPHPPPEGDASPRPGGVAPAPPHPPQPLLVVGQPPAVARDRLARDAVQVERPDVVPERVPEPLHVIAGGGGERLERRVATEELVVLRHPPSDPRP